MIELGLADGVSDRLRGIDSQISGMESGLVDTQSGFDDLGRATTEYGRVAGSEIEGVGKDVTELDKQVEKHADTTAKTADSAVKNWGMVGAAIGGAAIAAEAFVQSQQDMQYTAAKVAYMTDLEKREVAGLASELTTIAMSIEDVYGVMEIGAKQGLKSREELEKYVRTWDDLGTALEEDPVNLARQAIALRSVGIDADNLHDSYAALGFMIENTQWKGSDFLTNLGYISRDMDELGMSIDDVAITFAALERYRAQRPEDARRLLRTAMSGAKGDINAFYRELKITDEQLAQLHEEFAGGADYIAMANKEYAGTRSTLQVLGTEMSKVTNLIGADLNPVIGVGSAVMSGLSTVMITAAGAAYLYSVASTTSLIPSLGAATASAWAFTTALLANPITWIVLGIVGLGVALYLLASNWDDVSGWFMDRWEQVGSVVTGAIDWIGNAWDSTVGAIVAGAEWLMDHMGILAFLFPVTAPIAGMNLLRDNWDTVVGAIGAGWGWLVGAAQDGAAWLGETIGAGLSGIIDLFWQYHPLGIVIRQWDEITGYLEGIDLVETGRDILLGLVRGILDIRQQAIDAVMGIGEDILNAVTGFFGISSPSRLMQEMGGRVGEGFALGVAQSMPESIPLPDAIEGSIPPGPVRGGYATVWTEPAVSSLTGEAVYSSTLTEPVVEDLAGNVAYSSVLTEPVVGDLTGRVVYSSTLTEPVVEDLTGAITYLSTVIKPVVSELTGNLTYESRVSEPTIVDRTGTVVYEPEVREPTISNTLTGEVEYHSVFEPPTVEPIGQQVLYSTAFDEPAVRDLTGTVTYLSTVSEPIVPEISEEVTYSTTVSEPALSPLEGSAIWYSRVTEPTIKPLTGSVQYSSVIAGPDVPALTGELIYETRVLEPTIVDRAGTVVYETEVPEPTIGELTGAITYLAKVVEPAIPLLTGAVTYLSEVLAPEVPALAGTIEYGATLPGPGNLDRAGEVSYTPTIAEPAIDTLAGVVEYQGVLVGLPDVNDLTGQAEFGGREIDDTRAPWGPETDNPPPPLIYTPERDAPYMAGERSGDLVYSPTIHVTAGTSDANEIATAVDRRLRQTFDRHAETYFARQRRRAAL